MTNSIAGRIHKKLKETNKKMLADFSLPGTDALPGETFYDDGTTNVDKPGIVPANQAFDEEFDWVAEWDRDLVGQGGVFIPQDVFDRILRYAGEGTAAGMDYITEGNIYREAELCYEFVKLIRDELLALQEKEDGTT